MDDNAKEMGLAMAKAFAEGFEMAKTFPARIARLERLVVWLAQQEAHSAINPRIAADARELANEVYTANTPSKRRP